MLKSVSSIETTINGHTVEWDLAPSFDVEIEYNYGPYHVSLSGKNLKVTIGGEDVPATLVGNDIQFEAISCNRQH